MHRLSFARPLVMAAVAIVSIAGPALAQGASPAATIRAAAADISVRSGSVFTLKGERFQVSGVRAPRVTSAGCTFERLKGREARKTLQRLLRRGTIEIVPTGGVSGRGNRLVNVRVDGRSLRTLLLRTKIVLPSSQARGNPWCVRPSG